MPYSDPEKKKQYQDAYNKKYYQDYKSAKNLVGKATHSKTLLRTKKRGYLLNQLGHECPVCKISDPTVLVIKSTPQTFIRKWPTLKIICEVCLEKVKPNQKKALEEMFETGLPLGYTMDDDLLIPHSNL